MPKDLPAKPGIRSLPIEVDHHPPRYTDFEGDIPEGFYGAGKVEIWGKGEYELQQKKLDQLSFTLHGDKLQGEYTLVHTDAKNWLLFKKKGR